MMMVIAAFVLSVFQTLSAFLRVASSLLARLEFEI